MSRRYLVTEFGSEEDLLAATRCAHEHQYKIVDAYTPYAVHGLDEAMGIRPTRLAVVCLALGVTGAVAKLGFQIWTSAWDWPVNVGGKPLISLPAFVPVTFEVTVLFAGVGTVLAFLFRSRLFPGKRPEAVFRGVTDDKFALVLLEDDAAFDVTAVRRLFEPYHVLGMEERVDRG